jgi:hypothetical protein
MLSRGEPPVVVKFTTWVTGQGCAPIITLTDEASVFQVAKIDEASSTLRTVILTKEVIAVERLVGDKLSITGVAVSLYVNDVGYCSPLTMTVASNTELVSEVAGVMQVNLLGDAVTTVHLLLPNRMLFSFGTVENPDPVNVTNVPPAREPYRGVSVPVEDLYDELTPREVSLVVVRRRRVVVAMAMPLPCPTAT